ncbi:MAG: hypothetical protein ABIO70_11975 [Pseudomonadota bacterium]
MANGNVCELCGETFVAKRSDARFCSSACRSKSARARQTGGVATPVARVVVEAKAEAPQPAIDGELEQWVMALEERIADAEGDQAEARVLADIVLGYERRLVALEKKPAGGGADEATVRRWVREAIRREVEGIERKVAEAKSGVEELGRNVGELARRVKMLRRGGDEGIKERVDEIHDVLLQVIHRLNDAEALQGRLVVSVGVLERVVGVE